MTSDQPKSLTDVPEFTKDHFGYGIVPDGSLFLRKYEDDDNPKVDWVSDGYAQIVEEMRRGNGDSVFIVAGRCAKDGHAFRFEMTAYDFAEARKLKGKLTAQFGACNRVGGLTGDVIQQISLDVKKFSLIETPRWLDGKPAVPGLDLIPDLKYGTNSWVPVDVGGGDLSEAQTGLKYLLSSWDRRLTTIVLAGILGSPIVARWYPGDRFGEVLRAMTGSGKTEFVKHAMAVYGKGYLNEENLMRWGAGSTSNACMKVAATAGFLPYLVDNYKPLKKDDPAQLILLIQAVLEGSDKARLSSDSELKDSAKFACTLIITGEDFPEESSTMARCIILDWSPILDSNLLTQAQSLAHNFPTIGKEWFTWLSENLGKIEGILKDFETKRQDYYREIIVSFGGINAGRLSTNLALLDLIWEIALECPALAEVLNEFTQDFQKGIHDLLMRSPKEIISSNEAEEFVSTLNELIGTGRAKLVTDGTGIRDQKDVIGWIRSDGEVCIFPKVARKMVETVASTQQKVSSLTLYKQLDERGYIKSEIKDGNIERTLSRKFNGKANRVLVFKQGIEEKT
jgi:hypothetical protein